MILAVLEKELVLGLAPRCFPKHNRGISVDDPAIDLAVVAAILSSNEDIAVNKDFCFAGEWDFQVKFVP
jgi:DNA repair protein RadA/Sms